MATVRTNSKNYLFIDFQFKHDGKYHRAREGTGLLDTKENRKQVEIHANLISAEIKAGSFYYLKHFPFGNLAPLLTVRRPEAKTFKEYAENWLKENAPPVFKPSTHADYTSAVDKYLIPYLGEKSIEAITESDLKHFMQFLINSKGRGDRLLTPKRINNIFVPLKTMLSEAHRRGAALSNPSEHISPLSVGKSVIKPFSQREVVYLVEMLAYPWREMVCVALHTGVRTGELIALKWGDIDFGHGQINISMSRTRGIEGLPKTEASQRSIDILPPVQDALMSLILNKTIPTRYLFHDDNGKPLNADHIREQIWYPALDRLGVERRTLYQTRHTYASLMLSAGEDMAWIAAQMGTSIEMLSKTYARYIKSPTRRDGSAYIRMLNGKPTANE
jgi:integrase